MNTMPTNIGNTQNQGIAGLMQGQGTPAAFNGPGSPAAMSTTPQPQQEEQQPQLNMSNLPTALPDLAQALAAQAQFKEAQAARNNALLQQPQEGESVVQQNYKRLQMLEQQKAQEEQQRKATAIAKLIQQMQGAQRPVGDITQLASNLGDDDSYAGGGIVAFDGGGKIGFSRDVPFADDDEGSGVELLGKIASLLGVGVPASSKRPDTSNYSNEGRNHPDMTDPNYSHEGRNNPKPIQVANQGIVTPDKKAGDTAGARTSVAASGPAGSSATSSKMPDFGKHEGDYLWGKLKGIMGTDLEAERDKTFDWEKSKIGADEYAKRDEARIKSLEDLNALQSEGRTGRGLADMLTAFGSADPRKGLAGAAAAGSTAGSTAMEGWRTADMAFNKSMADQRRAYEKAVMDGNKDAAKSALKTMEELRNQKERALASGVSLENNLITREGQWKTAEAARLDRANQFRMKMAELAHNKDIAKDDSYSKLALKLATEEAEARVKAIEKQNAEGLRKDKQPVPSVQRLTAELFDQYYTTMKNKTSAGTVKTDTTPQTGISKYGTPKPGAVVPMK